MSLTQIVLIAASLMGSDVPWLNEVTRAPSVVPATAVGTMEPLLESKDGQPITTRTDWLTKRDQIKAEWAEVLGPMPSRPQTGFTVLKTEELDRVQRLRIRYECEPDLFVEAYLLKPKTKSRGPKSRPALVALHQTTGATIDEIAGVERPTSEQAIALKLAERGFVVICPKNFLWENASSLSAAVTNFKTRHPRAAGMHKMLYDAQRAIDIVLLEPEVDPQRLGAVGHSLGAKEVLYLTAFDDRIKASVASEGGLTFPSTNWDAPWYLGAQIRDSAFKRNHHELLALSAPRALLIMGGEAGPGAADGDRSWPLIRAAQPVYSLFESPVRLGLLNHHQGHSIPPKAFEKMAEWLETYLN